MKEKKDEKSKIINTHREARHHYEIFESIEAGIVLVGCEVKALRDSQCSLIGSFARFEGDQLLLQNAYIAPYAMGNRENPDPKRLRKLLLHKSQLEKLRVRTQEKGMVLIPLKLYFSDRGMVKVELGVGKGRKKADKRQAMAERDSRLEIQRALGRPAQGMDRAPTR